MSQRDEEWEQDQEEAMAKPADERYREIGQARIEEIREQLRAQLRGGT